ncbi:MAG TPA: AtpZ/AtpI family protein [bacterium]|nr:AtpZ/AtpI family protein [bacterium]
MVTGPHPPASSRADSAPPFVRTIAAKEALRARGMQHQVHILWFGLGLSGIVGWSVAIPALLGVAAGIWIDGRYPSQYSWTLMLLIGGVLLGCLNAWYWVQRIGRRIRQD